MEDAVKGEDTNNDNDENAGPESDDDRFDGVLGALLHRSPS